MIFNVNDGGATSAENIKCTDITGAETNVQAELDNINTELERGAKMRALDYANAQSICDHDVVNLQAFHQDYTVPKDGVIIFTGLNKAIPAGTTFKIWGKIVARAHLVGANSAINSFNGETTFPVRKDDDIDIDAPSSTYTAPTFADAFIFVPYVE